jgi:hypothetical protein
LRFENRDALFDRMRASRWWHYIQVGTRRDLILPGSTAVDAIGLNIAQAISRYLDVSIGEFNTAPVFGV